MKYLLFVALLVGCGKREPVGQLVEGLPKVTEGVGNYLETVGQIPRNLGRKLLGIDEDLREDVDNNSDSIQEIEDRLSGLETSLSLVSQNINKVEYDQDIVENTISMLQSDIAALQNKTTVREIIDPCGDNLGQFDEVLILLDDGSIIGYFEQGDKRFLTQLPDGNFRTTDNQQCNFTINNGIYSE